jgi:hypothetical protein
MSFIFRFTIIISLIMLTAPTLCDAVFPHLARAASTNSGSIARTVSSVAGPSSAPGASLFPLIGHAFAVGTAVSDYATGKVTAGGALQQTTTAVASTAIASTACSALGFVASPFATMACMGALGYVSASGINSVVGPPSVPRRTMCDQIRTILRKIPARFSSSHLEFDGNTCQSSNEWVKAPFDINTYEILLSNDGSISVTDRSGDFVIRYKFFGDKDLNIARKLNGAVVTDEPMSDFVKHISGILYS